MSQENTTLQPIHNNVPACQVCAQDALFQCSQCSNTFYCSRDHQFQDWKRSHKSACQGKKSPQIEETQKKILDIRKSFYENFSHKLFAECLLDVKVLVGLEKKRMAFKKTQNNELDYGATICLLVKSYLLLSDKKSAKEELQNYLKQNKAMIEDISEFSSKKDMSPNQGQSYDYIQRKLNLISCIGNLCYAIGMDCVAYYILYTKIVISFFGADSYEGSNCYFLIGCYYAEEGYFVKASQCFKKSANIRGQFAGDCFYNIGILHKLQKDYPKALETLQRAMKLRQEQYGEDSSKVAEVYELMGIIYTELNDFKTAMIQYQKAFKIRSTEPTTPQFHNNLELIHQLYDKLTIFIEAGQPKIKRPDIYLNLKTSIENQRTYWQLPQHKKKMIDNLGEKESSKMEIIVKKQEELQKTINKQYFEHNLVLKEQFTSTLSLSDLYRLSQLQIALEKCTSQFAIVFAIGTSSFYQGLSPENYKELQKDNLRLFQLIKLEELKKIQNTDI